jgi:hypothetical protein
MIRLLKIYNELNVLNIKVLSYFLLLNCSIIFIFISFGIKKGNREISFFYKYMFQEYYSSPKSVSVSSFSFPNLRETKIPTKSESAINPNEAHSGT